MKIRLSELNILKFDKHQYFILSYTIFIFSVMRLKTLLHVSSICEFSTMFNEVNGQFIQSKKKNNEERIILG